MTAMPDRQSVRPFDTMAASARIGVVIPSYRVTMHILDVITAIGPEIANIYVVDDCCPDRSGNHVEENCIDPRVQVIFRGQNGGVGAATITGYQAALRDGCDVVVKLDGDGQMDPRLIPRFVRPILAHRADYTKGNRFFNLDDVRAMPRVRLYGNAALSFITKLSTGYWTIFDPTNGYTAIHASLLPYLPLEKIAPRYFFESDMLFRLGMLRALVLDIPMTAIYADEVSHLRIGSVLLRFLAGHSRNFMKRLIYSYFLRDFSAASVELVLGLPLFSFGAIFGFAHWWENSLRGVATNSGTVMLAALPVILGMQLLLSFVGYDIAAVPRSAIHLLFASDDEAA